MSGAGRGRSAYLAPRRSASPPARVPFVLRTSSLHPYRLPLEPPFRWRGGEVAGREGVLLRLEGAAGRVGWGDAAPLPGFSPDALDEATAALERVLADLTGRELFPDALLDPASPFHVALDALHLPPSARYALDLALAELAAHALGRPLPTALHPDAEASLPVAALLDAPPERVVDLAAARVAEGYRALKLKAGRLDPEADAELARDVRRYSGGDVELRVDANRAWTTAQAAAFAERVRPARLAYVEEPLRAELFHELPALARDAALPVALDESLAEPGGAERLWDGLAAVVLKPTVLGGVGAVLRLAARARAVGARAVLSAAFESGVGQRGVAVLAAATGAEPAGLDPYRRLTADVFFPSLPLRSPMVDVPALFAGDRRIEVPADEP